MDLQFEQQYHNLEKHHFWFNGRRDAILKLISKYKIPYKSKILDIGCSSGILMRDLQDIGFKPDNLFGIDISHKAIENCKSNGFKNVFVLDAQNVELNEKFDVIIASDCLEHLEKDQDALSSWSKLLNKNGLLIVFVPAYMFLWCQHDVANHHFRRYTKKELVQKVKTADLTIERSSYWNFTLFLPVFIIRVMSRIVTRKQTASSSDLKVMKHNRLLTSILQFENRLLKKISFPFGVSTFCIASKKQVNLKDNSAYGQTEYKQN